MSDRPLSLDPAFKKLGREIERFANHTRKLLRASQKHRAVLEAASAWSAGDAPLDTTPESPATAMRAIDKFARVHRENRINLFGAYFAHHHLRIQAETSRTLLRASFQRDPAHRVETCRRVYALSEETRHSWVATLLDLSISAAAPDLSKLDFAALNVGALTDHEDVDLAIIVRTPEAQAALGRAFGTVSKAFVRYASKIQLFLTEQFSTPRTGALVDEYAQLLENPTRSVVSVTQLLGAQYLCGDRQLARALDERVIDSYYAGQGNPGIHEGFLRSVMTEIRHHLVPPSIPGLMSPKREVYVPSKLATTAVRVVHGVHEPSPPRALALVAERDPELRDTYLALADAFVQNEVLRALLFLYVSSADEFDLTDPHTRAATRRVALLLGLGESARRTAETRLIGMYTDIRARALRSVATLTAKLEHHLARVSTFRQLVERGEELHESGDNLAILLLESLESHAGSVFWDEVVELLGSRRATGLRFADDLERLPEDVRAGVARRFVRMMCEDAASLIEFLVFLSVRHRERSRTSTKGEISPNARIFWRAMMEHLAKDRAALESFTERLDKDTTSEALFRLSVAFPPGCMDELSRLIEEFDETTRGRRVVRAVRSVIILVHHRSNAIGRIAGRVLGRAPEFLQRLGDARRLKDLASEIRAQAVREPKPRQQIELLGDAFDVVALKTALEAILEGAPATRDVEFTAAVDKYVRDLFKACFREVHQRSAMFQDYRPGSRIALYATGGYGRYEAFGGDWDYIAVVDETDGGLQKFFGKVLQRVSGAMSRRGLHPHNRFTAHFNAYVVSMPELVDYFSRRGEETFIDEAEILEARFILGDPGLARRFDDEVRQLVCTDHADDFLSDILGELKSRRDSRLDGLNLKLAPGGLRDLHLLWLAIRVVAELPGPLVPELLPAAINALPECRSDLRFLMVANAELRRARDLYRLVVAFDDSMETEEMLEIAKDLAPLQEAGVRGNFRDQLERLLRTSSIRVDRIAEQIAGRVRRRSPSVS